MKVGVWQSNYLPWKGYFDYINDVDIFCWYDEVEYTKNNWRNRNRIFGNNGLFWITIPVDRKYNSKKISEVPINNKKILNNHFKSIQQNYSKAPYKNAILNLLYPYLVENPSDTLSKLNHSLIESICKYAGITTKFVNSKNYILKDTRLDRLTYLLQQLNATTYLSGLNAKNYITGSENEFDKIGCKLEWKNYGPYLKYERSGNDYDDYVSIIDVLMHIPQNKVLSYIKS